MINLSSAFFILPPETTLSSNSRAGKHPSGLPQCSSIKLMLSPFTVTPHKRFPLSISRDMRYVLLLNHSKKYNLLKGGNNVRA